MPIHTSAPFSQHGAEHVISATFWQEQTGQVKGEFKKQNKNNKSETPLPPQQKNRLQQALPTGTEKPCMFCQVTIATVDALASPKVG